MEEIKKAKERDEDWRKEVEELSSLLHRINQKSRLCVVLQNQQKARENTKQTSTQDLQTMNLTLSPTQTPQNNPNTDMGNSGTAPITETENGWIAPNSPQNADMGNGGTPQQNRTTTPTQTPQHTPPQDHEPNPDINTESTTHTSEQLRH